MLVKYEELKAEFKRILVSRNMEEERAEVVAKLFADNDLDGVHTHGSIRFPSFIKSIDKGRINIEGEPRRLSGFKAYEVWDGQLGIGNLNAKLAMDRAMELADEYGIGLVALKHTNHCMRGGSYAWQAADQGYVSISWTNSFSLMPMWGSKENNIGNNPLVLGVPREDGRHLVVDTALSQYSYGKLEEYRIKGKELPVYGGYDLEGNLTKDPAKIEESKRVLPIGYWKGSSLAFILDMVGLALTAGKSTAMIDSEGTGNFDLNQVFIAIDPAKNLDGEELERLIDYSLENFKDVEPVDPARPVRYPGERAVDVRARNLREGIELEDSVWEKLRSL